MAEHTASSNPSLRANWAANVESFVRNSIMRFRPAQQERDRLHDAHAQDLDAVALERTLQCS